MSITRVELATILVLVTLMTGGVLEGAPRALIATVKGLGYLTTICVVLRLSMPVLRNPGEGLARIILTYRRTILLPTLIYFLGLIIGALNGDNAPYALWQTISDGVVYAFALIAFGFLNPDLSRSVRSLLEIVSLGAGLVLIYSFIVYVGNLAGLWLINPHIHPQPITIFMNGPFKTANTLAYILMSGAGAAAVLALISQKAHTTRWLVLSGLLTIGIVFTFGRGAMLGTLVTLLAVLGIRHPRFALTLSVIGISTLMVYALVVSGGTLPLLSATRAVQQIPNEPFAGYRGLSEAQWLERLSGSEGVIVLTRNGTIRSPKIRLESGEYRLVLEGYGSEGQQNTEAPPRAPYIGVTILRGETPLVSDFIQLSTSTDYHIGSKFEVSPAADLHVEIRFYDDAKLGPRNDRNVFIKRVFLTNSNVPILRFPSLDFLPKVGFSGRIPIWRDALKNLADYGPLGVGAGQAKSRGEMSLHTFLLEQYGEGGVLTLMGVLGWLIMPILHIREARISSELGWGIVAMMAGLMVHGLFWSQFLNGLRFLTLVYVSLWTALSTGEAIPRVAR